MADRTDGPSGPTNDGAQAIETQLTTGEARPLPQSVTTQPPANPATVEKQNDKTRRLDEMSALLTSAYNKASDLRLTAEEERKLGAPFPDDVVEIKPTGEIYIPHIYIRERISQVFGRGQWSLIVRRDSVDPKANCVYCECVLIVRGCFAGWAVGAHDYQPTNSRMNYSDSLEAAQGDAIKRISAKALSCGDQCWKPGYIRGWLAANAVSTDTTDWRGKPTKRWTRRNSPIAVAETGHPVDTEPVEAKPKEVGKPGAKPKPSYFLYDQDNPFVVKKTEHEGVEPATIAPWGKGKGMPFEQLTEPGLIGHWGMAHDNIKAGKDVTTAVAVLKAAHKQLMEKGHTVHVVFES